MRDGPEMALYPVVIEQYPAGCFHHFFEVPYGRKRIDMVAVPRLDGRKWVVAIEFKVRDWRAGLWQARLNSSIVHRSFLAINARYMPSNDKLSFFDRAGVGLMAIDPEEHSVEIIIAAQSSSLRLKEQQVWDLWARRSQLGAVSG